MKKYKRQLLIGTILFGLTLDVNGQVFVDNIRVGQKMPIKIQMGGFKEEKSENCTCRTFSIKHQEGVGELGMVIGIHYDKKDSVIGVVKIRMRETIPDAQKVYISRLSEYMRNQNALKDRQLVKVRESDNGVVDGIFYFIYKFDDEKMFRGTGLVNNTIIEETYLPTSSYAPKLNN